MNVRDPGAQEAARASHERDVRIRMGLGLGVIVLTLLLLPLALNLARGGAAGVGFDPRTEGSELFFAVTYPASLEAGPLQGRLILVIARDSSPEPRLRVGPGPEGQQVFGMDVERWSPGQPVELTDPVPGFPLESIGRIPPGDYWVQGVLERYETYRLGDGRTLSLPAPGRRGLPWNLKPGNLLSRPVRVRIDPRSDDVVRVELSRRIPEEAGGVAPAAVQHVSVPSERLSAFWGRELGLEADVLLPRGWEEEPAARYPVVVQWGSAAAAAPEGLVPGLPPAIVVTLRQGSPYHPGFLAVNSANLGPWADALAEELLPEVEKRFRGLGAPWARALVGGPGAGWQATAALGARPDAYAGAWTACA